MKRAITRTLRATGRGLLVLALPKSVRTSTAELRRALPTSITPAARLALRIAVLVVIVGTVLAVRGAGQVGVGVAHEVLLLLGALAILAVSGALGPQRTLLARYMKREATRRGLTWRGRLFRTLGRRLEPATPGKEEEETNGH